MYQKYSGLEKLVRRFAPVIEDTAGFGIYAPVNRRRNGCDDFKVGNYVSPAGLASCEEQNFCCKLRQNPTLVFALQGHTRQVCTTGGSLLPRVTFYLNRSLTILRLAKDIRRGQPQINHYRHPLLCLGFAKRLSRKRRKRATSKLARRAMVVDSLACASCYRSKDVDT